MLIMHVHVGLTRHAAVVAEPELPQPHNYKMCLASPGTANSIPFSL
jgi:hypothetical protein